MEELLAYAARPFLFAARVMGEVLLTAIPDVLLYWCERKGEKIEKACKVGFLILLAALVLMLASLAGCATQHPDCEQADAFGHCQQWRGQPSACEKPDFLGFCPPAR